MHVCVVIGELEAKSERQAGHREFAAEDPNHMWRLHHSLNSPGKPHLSAQPQAMTAVPKSPRWPGKGQVWGQQRVTTPRLSGDWLRKQHLCSSPPKDSSSSCPPIFSPSQMKHVRIFQTVQDVYFNYKYWELHFLYILIHMHRSHLNTHSTGFNCLKISSGVSPQ